VFEHPRGRYFSLAPDDAMGRIRDKLSEHGQPEGDLHDQ
jgi:hypothetical protein